MSLLALSFTLVFVAIALGISMWRKLGMERDVIIATVRATIQLILVGYVLKFVFHMQQPIFTLIMVLFMIGVAATNAAKRGKSLGGVWWRVFLALMVTELVTQGVLLTLGVVPPTPRYVIPITGMIIGNAMVASSLLLNRLQSEASSHQAEILVTLSLGGSAKQAMLPYLKRAIRASMIPTVDSTKTTGLVQLPGMMTGQIIAGADPVQAVRYQLLILFTIMAGAAITTVILGFLTYRKLFNEQHQFILHAPDPT